MTSWELDFFVKYFSNYVREEPNDDDGTETELQISL